MTPEELNELRKSAAMVTQIGIHNAEICKHPYNGVNNASFALVNLPGLLAHIDQQAAQIEALKEKLVEERAKYVHQRDREAKFGGLIHELDKGKYYDEAHQQLADEMPGVTWE
jgi:hypothetical protein